MRNVNGVSAIPVNIPALVKTEVDKILKKITITLIPCLTHKQECCAVSPVLNFRNLIVLF